MVRIRSDQIASCSSFIHFVDYIPYLHTRYYEARCHQLDMELALSTPKNKVSMTWKLVAIELSWVIMFVINVDIQNILTGNQNYNVICTYHVPTCNRIGYVAIIALSVNVCVCVFRGSMFGRSNHFTVENVCNIRWHAAGFDWRCLV